MHSDPDNTVYSNEQLKVVPFCAEHMEDAEMVGKDVEIFVSEASELQKHPAVTMYNDDGVVLFIGIVIEKDLGFVWLVPTSNFRKHYFAAVKAIKRMEKDVVELFGLKRLVTNGHDDERVRCWLKFVGFESVKENIYVKEIA